MALNPENESSWVSDEQLVERYRQGHKSAFRDLVGRYQLELFNFLLRFSGSRAAAEDLFQETFLQVHVWADRFEVDRRFKPWLFTIAANKARDYLRKNKRQSTASLSAPVADGRGENHTYVDLLEAGMPQPSELLEDEETRERVRRIVQAMPDHLREVMLLSYFHQFAYREIAEMLNVPLGTVKSRLHSAVATFADQWRRTVATDGTRG